MHVVAGSQWGRRTILMSGFHTEGGGRPGIPPPPEKIDGNIISIMNVDVHYRK